MTKMLMFNQIKIYCVANVIKHDRKFRPYVHMEMTEQEKFTLVHG